MQLYKPFIVMMLAAALFSGVVQQARADTDAIAQVGLQETHKSMLQRRQEAQQRLRDLRGGPQVTAKKTGISAQATVLAPTPTGINPLVDVTLPNYANSPNLRKFVDSLPGLNAPNNLGHYISVGVPDKTAYPGSDYYEIGLVRYAEKLHSDLPMTELRGYVQLETAANAGQSKHIALTYPNGTFITKNGAQVYAFDNPQYLGPVIVATRNTPVRVKFTNFLPTGADGNLPLPVDTTIMGAGMGPLPMAGMPGMMESYTQNRATLHLHGGLTPWISDGTPHQWTCPAGETTQYPKGVSAQNVPDMPDPGPGSLNFYWTNQQSARLMFYHDHAYGITRLNVYAGEAAGYLITDTVEQNLVSAGTIPATQIPLVIQDKTFVNDATTPPDATFTATGATPTPLTAAVDPLWYKYVTGTKGGNLWIGHEYMPNENIYDPSGFNPMGRWDYGPWMIPPMLARNNTLPSPTIIPEAFMDTAVVNGTPYPYLELPPTAVRFRILNACNDRMLNLQLYKADPAGYSVSDGTRSWGTEVKMVPATPNPAFPTWPRDGRDGGVPDPTLKGPSMIQIGNECGFLAQANIVPPQPVDFDYNRRSVTFGGVTSKALLLPPAVRADIIVDLSTCVDGDTLILYNDAPAPMPLYDTRYDYFTGDPDQTSIGGAPSTAPGFGPNTRTVMQIRIKGTPTAPFNVAGLQAALPTAYAADQDKPLVPSAPFNTAYGTTAQSIYANSVDESLNITGTVQPVSQVVLVAPGLGYTTPPVVSFYGGGGTGAAATATLNGLTGITLISGGAGYTSPPAVSITGGGGTGAAGVATISGGVVTVVTVTVPGSNYTTAPTVTLTGGGGTGATAQANITLGCVGSINVTRPGSGYTSAPRVYLTGGGGTGAMAAATLSGALVMTGKNLVEGMDMEYGRMNAVLGSTPSPLAPAVGAGPVVGAAFYVDPPTEILTPDQVILWRISHIGVDSHAIHFHLFEVQVINRVDWTNTVKPPYPEELGWKETIRTNPFEDIIIAMRPKAGGMKLPFGIPNSNRLLDPTTPAGSTMSFLPVAPPIGVPAVAQTTNVMTNFGWEYVWHCHLLGHEENDMMRPIVFSVPTVLPGAPILSAAQSGTAVNCTWVDRTPVAAPTTPGNPANEIGYLIERATGAGGGGGGFTQIGTALANATSYSDPTVAPPATYRYRVTAYNATGNSVSNVITVATVPPPPLAPTNLAAVVGASSINLTWVDNANNETSYTCQRATDALFTRNVTSWQLAANTVSWSDTTAVSGTPYFYQVRASNAGGNSAWSNPATATLVTATPAAPSNLVVTANPGGLVLTWTDNSTNETGFVVQRATDANFTQGLGSWTPAANVTTLNDTSALPGQTYYYRVQAVNGTIGSTWSNTGSGMVPVNTTLTAPTNLIVSAVGPTSVTLGWKDNSNNETGFYVERSTFSSAGPWTRIATTAANAITYTNTGLARITFYYYRVQAFNASGASAYTNAVATRTQ